MERSSNLEAAIDEAARELGLSPERPATEGDVRKLLDVLYREDVCRVLKQRRLLGPSVCERCASNRRRGPG